MRKYISLAILDELREAVEKMDVPIPSRTANDFMRVAKDIVLQRNNNKRCIRIVLQHFLDVEAIANKQCPFCGRGFSSRVSLLKHLTHSIECGRKYVTVVKEAAKFYCVIKALKPTLFNNYCDELIENLF